MSCTNQSGTINKTFIIESPDVITGTSEIFSACTTMFSNQLKSCSGETSIYLTDGEVIFTGDIVPITPDTLSIGTPSRRFREINAVSGTVSVWSATTTIYTPELNMGLDISGNTRIITADNCVIQNDILFGGTF